jgi:uncharacterized protein
MTYSPRDRATLLGVALASIKSGLQTGRALQPDAGNYPPALNETRASFVTLNQDNTLRGCIGSLEPCTSLVCSVAENAYAAAFRDPRFPALTLPELAGLSIHISVLGPLQAVTCESEADLLRQMQPGIDGWVIQDGRFRGTFLPSVWESLPDARQFLEHLKLKAGLAEDYWSDTMAVWRYATESFSAPVAEIEKDTAGNFTAD